MTAVFGDKVRTGAIWSYAGQVFMTLGSFVMGVILARVLGPEDFGVFIAVTAFTSMFMMAVQFGMPQAIVQARELSADETNAAFWSVMALGLLFVGVIAVVAEPLSTLYRSERFPAVMYMMSGVFLLTPYTSVGLALLRREMRFDQVARLNMLALSVSAPASILAALLGAEVYALALGAILNMLIIAAGIAYSVPWQPRWPRIAPVRSLLGYSGFTTLNNLLALTTNRVDNMLVGAMLSTFSLGLYNRAYSLARMPSEQFSESLGPLVLGALSRIQDDVDWSRQLYFKAICAISLLTLPFLVFLLLAGPAAIDFLYGSQWHDAGIPLQVMVLGAVFVMLSVTLKGFAYAQALVRQAVVVNFLVLSLTVVAVVALAQWGLIAVAAGIVLREAVLFTLMVRVLGRSRIGLRLVEVLHAVAPALIAAATALLAGIPALDLGRALRPGDPFVLLLVVGVVVFVVYALCALVLIRVWRSHAPLIAAAVLLGEMLETLAARLRARRRPA